MGLTLKLQGSGALPTGVDRVAIKDGALTIGRGAENDLALPDPSRQVSKRHCVIEERDGSYVLIDVSTNGTFVNYGGDRIGEMGTVVGHGDVISIGPYELVIELSAEMPEMAPNPYASAHLPPAPDTESFERAPGGGVQASGHSLDDIASVLDGSGDPLGAGGGLGGSDDGLDALLGEGAPRAPQPGQAPIWRDAGARADRLADAGPVIPEDDDDFLSGPGDDPFQPGVGATADHAAGTNTFFRPTTAPLPADDLASDPAAPTGGAIGAPGAGGSIGGGGGSVGGGAMIPDDWEDDLLGGEPPAAPAGPPQGGPNADRASGPDFGASLNPHAPSGAAGLDAQPAGRPAPTAVSSGGGTGDPFADILDEPVDPPMPPAAAPAPPPAPPTPPASRAEAPQPAAPQPAVRDPVAREPAAGTAAARPTPPPAAAGGGGTDAATRAFLRAAGIEPGEMSEAEAIETMARCGAVFRTMVEGFRDVLMNRAAIKGEFRMQQTQIRSEGNNPLKFSVTPDQAVEVMIAPTRRGFLDATEAAREAARDIRAHEVATMTGMEAALKHLLSEVDPSHLAGRIETGGGLGGIFGNKKAKLWEAYETMYAKIATDVEDDFQTVFGREFARAYEEQLKKI